MFCAAPSTIDKLISSVQEAFKAMPRDTLDNVFLSVQSSMKECLPVDGENTVPLKHIGKAYLRHTGRLPTSLNVPFVYIHSACAFLELCDYAKSSDDDDIDICTPVFGDAPSSNTIPSITTTCSARL